MSKSAQELTHKELAKALRKFGAKYGDQNSQEALFSEALSRLMYNLEIIGGWYLPYDEEDLRIN